MASSLTSDTSTPDTLAPDLYPLELDRFLSPRLWGGERLIDFLKLSRPEGDEPIGESWQIYSENRILNGHFQGKTLAEVSAELGSDLIGTLAFERYGSSFPLLAKFIDAADKLSIQVHPDDTYAHSREAESGFHGKAEAWLILDAAPGASIIWGFKDELTPEEVKAAAEAERLEPHLNAVPVKPGDVIYNPAGTVHALNAGIFLFEIQQASDLTYRLYDYGRRDSKGNLRDLHLDKALEVADLTPGEHAHVTPKQLSGGKTELVRTEFFATEHWAVDGTLSETTHPTSAELFTVLSGELTLHAGEYEVTLLQGTSCVLPAALGDYSLSGRGVLLRCYIPD
jgi:mannose-6-phosphate isomerase